MRQDQPLADLITLGAYTGARIEELCNLKVDHVRADVLTIPGTRRTRQPARFLCIPLWAPVVARLVADSKDGYLIPTTVDNQYGERSSAIGKRFRAC